MRPIQAEWKLQDAKARFSDLFRKTLADGPQKVTRQGGGEVIVISAEDYERLAGRQRPLDLYEFIRNSPLVGSGLAIESDDQ